MTPYYAYEGVQLFHADCLDVLRALPDSSVDSVVTDPPYGLEFMGKEWDAPWRRGGEKWSTELESGADWNGRARSRQGTAYPRSKQKRCTTCGRQEFSGTPCACEEPDWEYVMAAPTQLRAFQSWCEQWAAECLRVLKPGGHLLAFGGTRTWHRLACAVEDAGFEIRDSIAWLYGSGFPKSLDVSKAIDKAAGVERAPVLVPTKPGNSPEQAGALALGATGMRDVSEAQSDNARRWQGWGTALKPAFEPVVVARKPLAGTVAQNVTAWGTGALNVSACRVQAVDASGGRTRHGGGSAVSPSMAGPLNPDVRPESPAGRWPANVVLSHDQAAKLDRQSGTLTSPAPYTRSIEANNRDAFGANAGRKLAGHQQDGYGDAGGASRFFPTFRYEPKAPTHERPRVEGESHATVKPLDLMRWLVRLVTPPGGTVLEPFAGSGTTAEACVVEGFRCIAIERESAYLQLIVARLSKPIQPDMFGGVG